MSRLARRPPRPRPLRRRLAVAARGVLAVVALVGLLVGVPAGLLALGANPLTVRLPSLDRLGQLLTSPDDGTVWLATARVVAWAGWAGFALSAVAEAAAAVVGSAVPVLRGLGAVQRPAGYLIALITTTLVAPTAAPAVGVAAAQTAVAAPTPPIPHLPPGPAVGAGSGAQASHPGTGDVATAPVGWAGAGPTAQALPTDHPGARLPVARVARYDTLWRLAERHLRDGRRWNEIYRLNTDRPQPDGARLTDPDQIRPGWLLLLPADATGLATPTVSAGPGGARDPGEAAGSVVVRPGDTLSGLAERHLGTAAATSALFEANAGRPQPDGGRLTDPDLIRPGWILTLPTHAPAPPTRRPHRPAPHIPTPPPIDRPGPPRPPATTTPPRPSPPVPPPSAPGSGRSASPPASPPAATPQATSPSTPSSPLARSPAPASQPAQRQPHGWVRLPSGSILAIGLAAAVAGMAALVRRRWRQHRLPADPSAADPPRPQLPAVATAAEAAWLATQRRTHEPDDTGPTQDATFGDKPLDEADEDPLDGPLDGAGPDQETGHHPNPQTSSDAEVDPAAADRGLTPGGLPAPSLLDLVGQPAGRGLAQHVWAGGVGLTGMGAAGAARAVLARLLTSCGPMGAQLLTTAAAAAELLPAEALDRLALVPGVRVFPTLPAALTAAEAELLGRVRRLADTESPDLTAYRQLPDAEPVPAVLLLAHTPDSTTQTARATAMLQLAAGRDLGAAWLGDWPPAALHVTADGTLHTTDEPRAAVGRVEILTAADAADLFAGLLPAVRDSLDVLDPTALLPAPAPVMDEPAEDAGERAEEPGAAAETADAADVAALGAGRPAGPAVLAVGVLGRVRLTAAPEGQEVTGLRAKVRDLLALLAVHPDGLGTEQVGEALWPDAPPGRVGGRLSATLALARRALRDAAGLDQTDASPAGDGLTRAGPAGEADGPVDLLPRTDGRYQLHPDLIDTDHRQFTTALATARRSAEAGDTAGQLAGLQLAADLYRGEALDGVAYPWAEPVRETLRRQGTDALARLADLLTTTAAASGDAGGGQRQAALAALERAVEVDPYNEELYRRIMRLHAEAGRIDAVRRTFRLLEARLADLDVDPDPDTASLAAQLTRPAPRPRPARTAAARR